MRQAVVRQAVARRGLGAGAVALALAAGCSGGSGTTAEGTATETTGTPTGEVTATGATGYELYLALGDSLAAGYQPTNAGDRTERDGGYAGLVRGGLPQPAPPDLVNLGCPGETTTTMLDGGRCTYDEGSQAAAAEARLAALPDEGEGTLVTLHVGANDVQRCVDLGGAAPRVDEECVMRSLATVRERLPAVLRRLRAAAPAARVVAVDYYNPYVVAALLGPQAQEFAVRSEEVQDELNDVVAETADAAGARVATVAESFAAGPRETSLHTPAVGPVCSVTWMCAEPPDIHPTDAGYALIADRVLEAATRTG